MLARPKTTIALAVLFLFLSSVSRGRLTEATSVYVVYAGPYSSSPTSAFGHLFLVLQPKPSTPTPLWDVVSFFAETEGYGLIRYFSVGILGGFLGSYELNKFHESTRNYTSLEDRDLWMLKLKMSPREMESLVKILNQEQIKKYPYTFFKKNCAFYIQELLSLCLPDIPKPGGLVGPISVFVEMGKSNRASQVYFRIADSQRLSKEFKGLSPLVQRHIKASEWQDLPRHPLWLAEQIPETQEFLQDYLQWKMLHAEAMPDSSVKQGLSALRVMVSKNRRLNSALAGLPGEPLVSPHFQSYSKLTIGFVSHKGNSDKYEFDFRPALHDVQDSWAGYRPVNTMELLRVRISNPISKFLPQLEDIILFSQRSLRPRNWMDKGSSWMLDLSGRRGGVYGVDIMHAGITSGKGVTQTIFQDTYTFLLIKGSILGADHHGVFLTTGIEGGVLWLPSNSWRLGFEVKRDYAISNFSHNFYDLKCWIRKDISSVAGTVFTVESKQGYISLKTSFSVYFE